MNNDGVSLTSAPHPYLPWYRRLWLALHRPKLSPDSLETIEINIKEPDVPLWNGILDRQKRLQDRYNEQWADNFAHQQNTQILNMVMGTNMSDNEIEKEIQAKGLTAPRVTLADIEAVIAYEYYMNASQMDVSTTPVLGPAHAGIPQPSAKLSLLTLCVLVLANGFTVTGESACASPENFDATLGRKIARQKAIDKVWMLEGYALKQRLFEESRPGLTREELDANATAKSDDPLGRPKTV